MRAFAFAMMLAVLACLGLSTGPAGAVPGGDLAVLTKGRYTCELPTSSSDPVLFAGIPQPDLDFDVIGDSSYRAKGIRGTYLMTGSKLNFTTGALEGRQLHKVGTTLLRSVQPDGTDGDLRCASSTQRITAVPVAGDDPKCKQRALKLLAVGKPKDELAC